MQSASVQTWNFKESLVRLPPNPTFPLAMRWEYTLAPRRNEGGSPLERVIEIEVECGVKVQ